MKLARLIITFAYVCVVQINSSKTERPHVILIIADDVGWNDVGFHGSNQIPTPNIDALAYNGMILNKFYTLPSCTPSRAALLTGQYPIRLGLQGIPISAAQNLHLPLDIPTLPEKLKRLGYYTGLVGKWHLGCAYKNLTPTARGFDKFVGYWNGYIDYFQHYAFDPSPLRMTGLDLHDDQTPLWEKQGEYATHLFDKAAEEIILNHNEETPLFLTVAHLAAHTGKYGTDLEVPNVDENNIKFAHIEDEKRSLYAGIVSELDTSVGRIVETLNTKGMLEDSLVIFISDNGGQTLGLHQNMGSNWPLRGLKMTAFEGGIRNIGVIYNSKMGHKGSVNNEFIHISDLMPTIYAAAGGDINDLGNIDGINQWQTLTSGNKSIRTEILINIDEVNNQAAIIGENTRFKLINGSNQYDPFDGFYGVDGRHGRYDSDAVMDSMVNRAINNGLLQENILTIRGDATLDDCRSDKKHESCPYNHMCLFDLLNDPCETTNVAGKYPEIVAKLSERLLQFREELLPQKPVSTDPNSNPIYFNNSWTTWLDTNTNSLQSPD